MEGVRGVLRMSALAALMVALSLSTDIATNVTTTPPVAGAAAPAPAYWLVASDGGIFSFGGAPFYGSTGGMTLNAPIVGMAATPDGGGYWLVASDGGIFSYGDARFYGSTGAMRLNQPIVGMTATPDGGGYWLVASDGGIFSFGDAQFYGSTGAMRLNQPVVGMASAPDGHGYWLVASDGGIFTFGDAQFYGSTGAMALNAPIVAMVAGPGGSGYSLVASDGGVFSFGSSHFYGSLGSVALRQPVVAAVSTPGDTGYWFTDRAGHVFNFGAAAYDGSAPAALAAPVVGAAEAPGNGSHAIAPFASGSYGYDVSVYDCAALPPDNPQIGIVEVDGSSSGNPNPCLAQEAAWAGDALNLYTFLTFGTSPNNVSLCDDYGDPVATEACNAGYAAGIQAYQDASAAGVDTAVPWWLDVEPDGGNWTGNTSENAALVQGALAALHETEGVAEVGIYASPGNWNTIVGDYQPDVPYWMADWLIPPSGPGSCADYADWVAAQQLPTGPLELVQYDSDQYDEDYAC